MKKILLFLATSAALSGANLDFGVGARQDYVQWAIGMHPYTPDILSELKWENVWSANVFVAGSGVVYRNIGLDGFLNVGKVFSGHVWDRDYWGNGRTEMFSESRSDADKGSLFDVEVGANSCIPLFGGTFTDRVGYGYHKMHLSMTGGWHSDIGSGRFFMPMPDLNNTYKAEFFGPYIGFIYQRRFGAYQAAVGYNYSFIQYKGDGYWNLRTDFHSNFIHKSDKGFGHTFTFNLQTPVSGNWQGGFAFLGRYFKIYNGADHIYFTDGVEKFHVVQKLVNVHWINLSFYLYLQYFFDTEPKRISTRDRLNHSLRTK